MKFSMQKGMGSILSFDALKCIASSEVDRALAPGQRVELRFASEEPWQVAGKSLGSKKSGDHFVCRIKLLSLPKDKRALIQAFFEAANESE